MEILDQLYHFTDDLEASLDYDPGESFDVDSVILCGVGGSAVSGDFAADCCFAESRIPIKLVKYPDIPSWAGPRTLAVVSSYSGNTAETMEMYRQAAAAGCVVFSVTSGGLLREASERDGSRMVLLPEGMHPRHAIGYMIGYTLAVIRAAGGPDLRGRIRGFLPALREYRDVNALPDGCLARDLAREYEGRVPVICSDGGMRSVAFRWKTQVNENSKFVAFCDSSPAFAHHSLDAWRSSFRDDYLLTLLVSSGPEGDPLREAAAELPGARVIRLEGSSPLENMFRAIILGDYMSFYMADNRGVDPSEVRPVMQMKAKLAQSGISRRATRGSTPPRRRTLSNASLPCPGPWTRSTPCTSARCRTP